MPHIATHYFGTIPYSDDSVISIPAGLPGFPEETQFLPIDQATSKPFVFLQSVKSGKLCFLTLPVRVAARDFEPRLEPEDLQTLGLPLDTQPRIGKDVLILTIVSVDEKEPPTANLLAPVVINLHTRRGVQAVQTNSVYSHRHPLFEGNGY